VQVVLVLTTKIFMLSHCTKNWLADWWIDWLPDWSDWQLYLLPPQGGCVILGVCLLVCQLAG